MSNNSITRLFIILQVLIGAILLTLLGVVFYSTFTSPDNTLFLSSVFNLGGEALLVIGAMIANISLSVKHRHQTAEGYLIPLYLLCVTLQTLNVFPSLYDYTGYLIMSVSLTIKLARFFFLFSSVVLFYASIQNLKLTNVSKLGTHIISAAAAVLLLSFVIPAGSEVIPTDRHNGFLTLIVFIVNMIASTTYFFALIKERESYSTKHFITMFLLIWGEFLVMVANSNFIASIIGLVFFWIGAIMLASINPDGY